MTMTTLLRHSTLNFNRNRRTSGGGLKISRVGRCTWGQPSESWRSDVEL